MKRRYLLKTKFENDLKLVEGYCCEKVDDGYVLLMTEDEYNSLPESVRGKIYEEING